MRACPSTEPEISICVLARLPCSEDSDDGTGTAIGAMPICHRPSASPIPRIGTRGYSGFNYKTGKCNCSRNAGDATLAPDKTLWSNYDSPYCYEPPWLILDSDATKYDRKVPDKVIKLQAYADITKSRQFLLYVKKP